MLRARRDALVSLGVPVVVLAVIISVDVHVREWVRAALPSALRSTPAGIGTQLSDTASAVFDAARTQSIEHGPMMIFVVVATVLLLCMARI
jgi:hypothetical protein